MYYKKIWQFALILCLKNIQFKNRMPALLRCIEHVKHERKYDIFSYIQSYDVNVAHGLTVSSKSLDGATIYNNVIIIGFDHKYYICRLLYLPKIHLKHRNTIH